MKAKRGVVEATTDQQPDAGLLRRVMCAHEPGDEIVIRDGKRCVAPSMRDREQIMRRTGAAQKRVVRG